MNNIVLFVCIAVIGILFSSSGFAYAIEQSEARDHKISLIAMAVAGLLIIQVVHFNDVMIRRKTKKLEKELERSRFLSQQDYD